MRPSPPELCDDLSALVASLSSPLKQARAITSLPSPSLTRATFRLEFVDGRTLKGRCLERAEQAQHMQSFLRRLAHPALTRVLAQRGTALLEQWIEGTTLDSLASHRRASGRSPKTSELLRCSGEILGSIHASPVAERPSGIRHEARGEWRAKLEKTLRRLRDLGTLEASTAAQLQERAMDQAPRAIDIGIVHGDLRPANLVVDAAGALFVVDNERAGIGALDEDLARSWVHWQGRDADRELFLAGYRSHRSTTSFEQNRSFWLISVLARSLLFRVEGETPGALDALAQLTALARD